MIVLLCNMACYSRGGFTLKQCLDKIYAKIDLLKSNEKFEYRLTITDCNVSSLKNNFGFYINLNIVTAKGRSVGRVSWAWRDVT